MKDSGCHVIVSISGNVGMLLHRQKQQNNNRAISQKYYSLIFGPVTLCMIYDAMMKI